MEKGGDSPYGKWEDYYVVVTYDGSGYDYYWTSRDETNTGIYLTYQNLLDVDRIENGVSSISTSIGVGDREKILLLKDSCDVNDAEELVATFSIEEKKEYDNQEQTLSVTSPVLGEEVHIGDYVDYDAGIWDKSVPITSESLSLGGYTQGSSRNHGVICDGNDGVVKSGWRVIDISSDVVTLVSAGLPECYANVWGKASESITYLTSHDYSEYVNSNYATKAGILTKDMVDKVNGTEITVGSDVANDILKAGGRYWIPYIDSTNTNNLMYVQPGGYVGGMGSYYYGIRVVVELKKDIYIQSGTGTETDPYVLSKNPVIKEEEVKVNRYGTITGYWENWKSDNAMKLSSVPINYDVVAVSFALEGSTDGAVTFSLDPYLQAQLNYNEEDFIEDIKTLKSRGQKVILSIGGATANIVIDDDEAVEQFVNTTYDLIQKYGFNGVDINIENEIYPEYLTKAINQLVSKVGSNMILTFTPQTVDFKVDNSGTVSGSYYEVFKRLNPSFITMIHMQMYNTGDQYGLDGVIYYPGTTDFLTALSDIMIENGIPASKVSIGINAVSSKTGYVEPNVVLDAFHSMRAGGKTINGSYQISQANADFGGIMVYSINKDKEASYKFIHAFVEGMKK